MNFPSSRFPGNSTLERIPAMFQSSGMVRPFRLLDLPDDIVHNIFDQLLLSSGNTCTGLSPAILATSRAIWKQFTSTLEKNLAHLFLIRIYSTEGTTVQDGDATWIQFGLCSKVRVRSDRAQQGDITPWPSYAEIATRASHVLLYLQIDNTPVSTIGRDDPFEKVNSQVYRLATALGRKDCIVTQLTIRLNDEGYRLSQMLLEQILWPLSRTGAKIHITFQGSCVRSPICQDGYPAQTALAKWYEIDEAVCRILDWLDRVVLSDDTGIRHLRNSFAEDLIPHRCFSAGPYYCSTSEECLEKRISMYLGLIRPRLESAKSQAEEHIRVRPENSRGVAIEEERH